MVVQINQFCTNAATPESCAASAYGLNNILDDYEITHGMQAGRDYEMAVMLPQPGQPHGAQGYLGARRRHHGSGRNPFEDTIRRLMACSVKFCFCQNTTRAYLSQSGTAITSLPKYLQTGISATDQMIEDMEYTTARLTLIADLQERGYAYIQP